MSNINELVFEAMQSTSGNDNSQQSTKSTGQSSQTSQKGFGAPSVMNNKSNVSISQPKTSPIMKPGMITKPNMPSSSDFMKKNKPKFGLGSGKSLMGW